MDTSIKMRDRDAEALATVFETLVEHRSASVDQLDQATRAYLGELGIVVSDRAALADDLELLSARKIRAAMAPDTRRWLRELSVLAHAGSTNTLLLDRLQAGGIAGRVVTAEVQTAGRGRRGGNG